MNYVLFDGPFRDNLLPFTYTKPVAELRVGILTIREKWEIYLEATTTTITEDYLSDKYPMVEMEVNIMINASMLPTPSLVKRVKALRPNQALYHDGDIVAFSIEEGGEPEDLSGFEAIDFNSELLKIEHTWDLFRLNGEAISQDFELITAERTSEKLSKSVQVFGKHPVFVEPGATLECVTLNTNNGPIYIGKNAEVMEGSLIRGPFALCEHAVVKLGAKIYGPTTIGPYSKVGGEVNNSILMGYSNKGHDGFLGNSVLGEWCNIGADSNTSNLKNNYAEVRLWDYQTESFAKTGLQFCGLMMGDHSKCGINTMFNTGTVVGVSANIFGSGFPRNFVPSFSWGGSKGFVTYRTDKAFEVAEKVMERRNEALSEQDKAILTHVFELSAKFRKGD
jgi:UDP-N-acetylglucosamine diphosphorylase/glucosamine-1-phosphate N-acetyltransferase